MEIWKAEQGDSLRFTAALRDESGDPFTAYLGTEDVTAVVWAGDERVPIAGAATAVWANAAAGTVTVTIVESATADLAPGTYFLKDEVDGAQAFVAALELEGAPGVGRRASPRAHFAISGSTTPSSTSSSPRPMTPRRSRRGPTPGTGSATCSTATTVAGEYLSEVLGASASF